MIQPARISFAFIVGTLLLVGGLHLATPLLVVLFSFFALSKLQVIRAKWEAIALFLLLVAAVFFAFVHWLKEAFDAVPPIITTSIPSIVQYARDHHVDLPFDDLE